jgi:hypothetical protein
VSGANEDATTTMIMDEGDELRATRKQQSSGPTTPVTPAVDNVDEVAMLNNAAQRSPPALSSSSVPLDPITRDNMMLMEDDNEGLVSKKKKRNVYIMEGLTDRTQHTLLFFLYIVQTDARKIQHFRRKGPENASKYKQRDEK